MGWKQNTGRNYFTKSHFYWLWYLHCARKCKLGKDIFRHLVAAIMSCQIYFVAIMKMSIIVLIPSVRCKIKVLCLDKARFCCFSCCSVWSTKFKSFLGERSCVQEEDGANRWVGPNSGGLIGVWPRFGRVGVFHKNNDDDDGQQQDSTRPPGFSIALPPKSQFIRLPGRKLNTAQHRWTDKHGCLQRHPARECRAKEKTTGHG